MGNTVYQRLYSKLESEDFQGHEFLGIEFDEASAIFGARLLFGEQNEIIAEKIRIKMNNIIYEKAFNKNVHKDIRSETLHRTIKETYPLAVAEAFESNSLLEGSSSIKTPEIRPLELIKEHQVITEAQLYLQALHIKYLFGNETKKVNEIKGEIDEYINKYPTTPKNPNDQTDKEKQSNVKDKVLILTLQLFVRQVQQALEEANLKKIERYISRLDQLVDSLEPESKVAGNTENEIELENILIKLGFILLKVLHSELKLDSSWRMILVRFIFNYIRYLGRKDMMILLLDYLKDVEDFDFSSIFDGIKNPRKYHIMSKIEALEGSELDLRNLTESERESLQDKQFSLIRNKNYLMITGDHFTVLFDSQVQINAHRMLKKSNLTIQPVRINSALTVATDIQKGLYGEFNLTTLRFFDKVFKTDKLPPLNLMMFNEELLSKEISSVHELVFSINLSKGTLKENYCLAIYKSNSNEEIKYFACLIDYRTEQDGSVMRLRAVRANPVRTEENKLFKFENFNNSKNTSVSRLNNLLLLSNDKLFIVIEETSGIIVENKINDERIAGLDLDDQNVYVTSWDANKCSVSRKPLTHSSDILLSMVWPKYTDKRFALQSSSDTKAQAKQALGFECDEELSVSSDDEPSSNSIQHPKFALTSGLNNSDISTRNKEALMRYLSQINREELQNKQIPKEIFMHNRSQLSVDYYHTSIGLIKKLSQNPSEFNISLLFYILGDLDDSLMACSSLQDTTNKQKVLTREQILDIKECLQTLELLDFSNSTLDLFYVRPNLILLENTVHDNMIKIGKFSSKEGLQTILTNKTECYVETLYEFFQSFDKTYENARFEEINETVKDEFKESIPFIIERLSFVLKEELIYLKDCFVGRQTSEFSHRYLQQNIAALFTLSVIQSFRDADTAYLKLLVDAYFKEIGSFFDDLSNMALKEKENLMRLTIEARRDQLFFFDNSFSISLIGLISSLMLTVRSYTRSDFFDQYNSKMSAISRGMISLINNLGESLRSISSTSQRSKTTSKITINKDEIAWIPYHDNLKKLIEIKLDTSNDDNYKTLKERGVTVMLFRLISEKAKKAEIKCTDVELVDFWTSETTDKIVTIADGEPHALIFSSSKSFQTNIKIKMEATSSTIGWLSNLTFLNMAKYCLMLTTEMMSNIKESSGISYPEITDEDNHRLDRVLGSALFDQGANFELMESILPKLDLEVNPSKLDTCEMMLNNLLTIAGLESIGIAHLNLLIQELQKKIRRRLMSYDLGGKVGLTFVTSLFILALKHQDRLNVFTIRLNQEEPLESLAEDFVDLWLESSEIRNTTRKFEVLKDFVNAFEKIYLLFSMTPSEKWFLQFDGPRLIQGEEDELKPDKRTGSQVWNKVKHYITALKFKSNKVKEDSKLIPLMLRLIEIPLEVSQIKQVLEYKLSRLESTTKGLNILKEISSSSQKSLLSGEITEAFERMFRREGGQLEYLCENYNGLNRQLVSAQISSFAQMLKKFVEYVCSSENPLETKLSAISNLKWKFRGKEKDIVGVIDIESMLLHNQESPLIIESILELIEILMTFVEDKVSSIENDDDNQLTLKRHVSMVDEHSIANILTKNFQLLLSELISSINEINVLETQDRDIYELLKSERPHKRNSLNTYWSLALNLVVDIKGSYSLIGESTYFYTGDNSPCSPLNREYLDRLLNASKKNNLMISISKSLLSIFYKAILRMSETAAQFFSIPEHLNIMVDIIVGTYPEDLQIIAANIITSLSDRIPMYILARFDEIIETIKIELPKKEEFWVSFIRGLLKKDPESASEIINSIASTHKDSIYRILDPSYAMRFRPGLVVRCKNDNFQADYVLLSRYSNKILREHSSMVERREKEAIAAKKEKDLRVRQSWPAFNLRIKKVDFFLESDLSPSPFTLDNQIVKDVIDGNGLWNLEDCSNEDIFRMARISTHYKLGIERIKTCVYQRWPNDINNSSDWQISDIELQAASKPISVTISKGIKNRFSELKRRLLKRTLVSVKDTPNRFKPDTMLKRKAPHFAPINYKIYIEHQDLEDINYHMTNKRIGQKLMYLIESYYLQEQPTLKNILNMARHQIRAEDNFESTRINSHIDLAINRIYKEESKAIEAAEELMSLFIQETNIKEKKELIRLEILLKIVSKIKKLEFLIKIGLFFFSKLCKLVTIAKCHFEFFDNGYAAQIFVHLTDNFKELSKGLHQSGSQLSLPTSEVDTLFEETIIRDARFFEYFIENNWESFREIYSSVAISIYLNCEFDRSSMLEKYPDLMRELSILEFNSIVDEGGEDYKEQLLTIGLLYKKFRKEKADDKIWKKVSINIYSEPEELSFLNEHCSWMIINPPKGFFNLLDEDSNSICRINSSDDNSYLWLGNEKRVFPLPPLTPGKKYSLSYSNLPDWFQPSDLTKDERTTFAGHGLFSERTQCPTTSISTRNGRLMVNNGWLIFGQDEYHSAKVSYPCMDGIDLSAKTIFYRGRQRQLILYANRGQNLNGTNLNFRQACTGNNCQVFYSIDICSYKEPVKLVEGGEILQMGAIIYSDGSLGIIKTSMESNNPREEIIAKLREYFYVDMAIKLSELSNDKNPMLHIEFIDRDSQISAVTFTNNSIVFCQRNYSSGESTLVRVKGSSITSIPLKSIGIIDKIIHTKFGTYLVTAELKVFVLFRENGFKDVQEQFNVKKENSFLAQIQLKIPNTIIEDITSIEDNDVLYPLIKYKKTELRGKYSSRCLLLCHQIEKLKKKMKDFIEDLTKYSFSEDSRLPSVGSKYNECLINDAKLLLMSQNNLTDENQIAQRVGYPAVFTFDSVNKGFIVNKLDRNEIVSYDPFSCIVRSSTQRNVQKASNFFKEIKSRLSSKLKEIEEGNIPIQTEAENKVRVKDTKDIMRQKLQDRSNIFFIIKSHPEAKYLVELVKWVEDYYSTKESYHFETTTVPDHFVLDPARSPDLGKMTFNAANLLPISVIKALSQNLILGFQGELLTTLPSVFSSLSSFVLCPSRPLLISLAPDLMRLPATSHAVLSSQLTSEAGSSYIEASSVYLSYLQSRMKKERYLSETEALGSIFYRNFMSYYRLTDDQPPNIKNDTLGLWLDGANWLNFGVVRLMSNAIGEKRTSKGGALRYRLLAEGVHYMPQDGEVCCYVDRFRGMKAEENVEKEGLLAQLYFEMRKGREFDDSRAKKIAEYEINFEGEPGIDAGGPRREYMRQVSEEIRQKLKLFIPSPNSQHNMAKERDRCVPNPQKLSYSGMKLYYIAGFVQGVMFKTGDILTLNLPSIYYRFLMGEKLKWQDVDAIDSSIIGVLDSIEKLQEDEIEYFDFYFEITLFDSTVVELKPNGRKIKLTIENRDEYICLFKEKYLSQLLPAFIEMRRGFLTVIMETQLRGFTSESLEQSLEGMNYVDIEVLKQITTYSGFDKDHKSVKMFWNVLESFDQNQLSLYLQYVWGRSRLSYGLSDNHRLTYHSSKTGIPEAHTCFFELDLGDYPSEAELKRMLLYGIENCREIAESSRKYNLDADFGM